MDTYAIDSSRSRLTFAVHGLAPTRGTFTQLEGTVVADTDGIPQSLTVTIPADTLDTHLLPRDLHLKTATFFDAQRYPEITYRGEYIERTGSDQFAITGILSFHGVQRPFELVATVREDEGIYRAHVTGSLSRSAFAVPRNPILRAIMRSVIGDEVAIAADVVVARTATSDDAAPLAKSLASR